MAVPKRKTSKSKNSMRQAGKGLKRKTNLKLNTDGSITISHIRIFKKKKKNKKEERE